MILDFFTLTTSLLINVKHNRIYPVSPSILHDMSSHSETTLTTLPKSNNLRFRSSSLSKSVVVEVYDPSSSEYIYRSCPQGFFGCQNTDPFVFSAPLSSFPVLDGFPDCYQFMNVTNEASSTLVRVDWLRFRYECVYRGILLEWSANWTGSQVVGKVGDRVAIDIQLDCWWSSKTEGAITVDLSVFSEMANELGVAVEDNLELWRQQQLEIQAFLVMVGLTVLKLSRAV